MLRPLCALFLCLLCSCHKPDPNVSLLDAAEAGNLPGITNALGIGAKVNYSSPVKFGWTPLLAAVFHNNTNVIPYLVEAAGADINLASNDGETPLMMAVSRGDDGAWLVNYLIDKGADLNRRDNSGRTVFELAKSSPPRPKIIELLAHARKPERPGMPASDAPTNPAR
jgi:ankyrin repeat protein